MWGSEDHVLELFGDRVEFTSMQRSSLEITAFKHPLDYREHFKERYGPTIATFNNARSNGREEELDQAMANFCYEWNRGSEDKARFEKEYLLAIGTKR